MNGAEAGLLFCMNTILNTSQETEKSMNLAVSIHSIRKSGRVLYAFTQFYLPFYDRDLGFLFLDQYDLFGGLSATIYEIDEMIEAGVNVEVALSGLDQLLNYLESRIHSDVYIRERFDDARRYYRFEANLLQGAVDYSFADLAALTEIRSFDFRLMHRVLAQLSGQEDTDRIFAWFYWFEMLMELEDDLLSAQKDMDRGTYNIFSLATRISSVAAPAFVENLRTQ